MWPFVLQFSSSPFDFISSPFCGCLRWWGRFQWPWGKFSFCSALLVEVDFVDLEANLFRFLWPSYGVVDFVDFEVVIYFLQCASCWRGRSLWPWGTNLIFTVRWLRWGRFHWPWGTRLFSAVDHSYDIQTPGFLEILVADSTLTCFCVCIRSSSFPLKWLSSSKMASLRPSIPLLGWWPAWSPCGPRIPASPSLWLMWVGSPFKMAWQVSATVVSPDQEMDLWNSCTRYFHSASLSLIPHSWSYWLLWLLLTLPITCPNGWTG